MIVKVFDILCAVNFYHELRSLINEHIFITIVTFFDCLIYHIVTFVE